MKAILYTGAALMIGAGIYGFADYRQTSQKKDFKVMYTGENTINSASAPVHAAVITDKQNTETITTTETNTTAAKSVTVKKKAKKKRTFNTRLFSRGALDERFIDPLPPVEKKMDTLKSGNKN
ncbi:MAG: hypothetical protein NTW29_14130 [Bacteroidetes bacterium]|nr:hypothetical protein [Bacteroidota bacterium]